MAPVEELALLDRSNRGASKQRRDQINVEINNIRELLPLAETSRQRLSQLQIMSLSCVYIRKCNLLQKLFRSKSADLQLPNSIDFFQALTGFILVTTKDGKLLYISENVTDFLGHSMVDMKTQGDSLYDIVDKRDHGCVQAKLQQTSEDKEDITFFCRMNMSRTLKRQSGFGDVKVMHVRGHFVNCSTDSDNQPVFMATCSPLVTPDLKENLVQNSTTVFKTVHQLDMSFVEITKTAEYYIGSTNEELAGKSWYSMIHPGDIHEAKEKHVQLIRSNHEMGSMITVRMLKADGSFFWVNVTLHIRQTSLSQNEEPFIVCMNQVVSAEEAYQIKVQGHVFSMSPPRSTHEIWPNQLPNVVMSPEQNQSSWLNQGSNSVQIQGYSGILPNFASTSTSKTQAFPSCQQVSGQINQGLQQYTGNATVMHTDQLKAMLKRKIQGPQSTTCRPSKVAKVSWNNHSTGSSNFNDIEPTIQFVDQFGSTFGSSGNQGQSDGLQFVGGDFDVGVLMMRSTCPTWMKKSKKSQIFMNSKTSFMSEQVVPDINVPDSFLTPDPSPISSPQPNKVAIKTEVLNSLDETSKPEKCSVSILQALERLASLPRETKLKECKLQEKPKEISRPKKVEKKELPIFDAFEIDNFFDNLEGSKASSKVEEPIQIKTEIVEGKQPSNFSSFVAPTIDNSNVKDPVKMEIIKTSIYSSSAFDNKSRHSSQENWYNVTNDSIVPSTMAFSPSSSSSNDIDLLSCFSDDGFEMSQIQLSPGNSLLEQSIHDSLTEDRSVKSPFSDCGSVTMENAPVQLPGDLTHIPISFDPNPPQTHSFDLALDAMISDVNGYGNVKNSSYKDRDVLGTEMKELDFFFDGFIPQEELSQSFKHGQ